MRTSSLICVNDDCGRELLGNLTHMSHPTEKERENEREKNIIEGQSHIPSMIHHCRVSYLVIHLLANQFA